MYVCLCVLLTRCSFCDARLWSQSFTFIEIQPVIDFLPCKGTDSRKIISLFFPLPHFTGNFHVVNGGIDSCSALFVLHSVHHLRRKTGIRAALVWLNGGIWSMAPTRSAVLLGIFAVWFELFYVPHKVFGSVYCYHFACYTFMTEVFFELLKKFLKNKTC